MNEMWGKMKMEDGKKTECWELQVNVLLAMKSLQEDITFEMLRTAQKPVSAPTVHFKKWHLILHN